MVLRDALCAPELRYDAWFILLKDQNEASDKVVVLVVFFYSASLCFTCVIVCTGMVSCNKSKGYYHGTIVRSV